MGILVSIGIILLWMIMGFIAFIWNSKQIHREYFDDQAKKDLIFFIVTGLISIIGVIFIALSDKFNDFMDYLLKKINK